MSAFETFGKYKLTERLAIGGMAEVFLGTIEGAAGFTKMVVIKRLHPQYNRDKAFIQMLIDEARLTSQLNHGNICQVYDLGEEEGSYFIALEYIAGEDVRTLQDHCRRAGDEFPIAAGVFIVSETLAGLDYAHRKEGADGPMGIIHRDVSPQNILISYEGEVKVIDFGIAKARTRMAKETEAGVIKGKFRYMSPEQASGLRVDNRTDVFAAGVVLYELLAGETHALNLPDTEVLRRMRAAEFEPLRKRRRGIPGKLEKIVHKALGRKASQRYATAAEFRAALLKFLQSQKVTFGSAELSKLMGKVFSAERRKRRNGSFSGVLDQVSAATNKRNAAGPTPSSSSSVSRPSPSGRSRLPGPLTDTGTEQMDDEEEVEISTSALVDLDMPSQPAVQPPPAPPATGGWVAFAPTTPFGGEPGETGPLPEITGDMDMDPTREVNMPPVDAAPPARPQQYVHIPSDEQAPIGDSEGTALFMSLDEDDLEFFEGDDADEEPTTAMYVESADDDGLSEEKTRAIKRSAIEQQRPPEQQPLSEQPTEALSEQPTEALSQPPTAPLNQQPEALSEQPTALLNQQPGSPQPSVVVGPAQPEPLEGGQQPAEGLEDLPSVIVEPSEARLYRQPTSMLDPRRKAEQPEAFAATAPQHVLAATQQPAAPEATAALAQTAAPEPAAPRGRCPAKSSSGALRTIIGGLVVLVLGGSLALGLLWWRPAFLFMDTADADRPVVDAGRADISVPPSDKPGPGEFRVHSKPPGASISLCGKPTGKKTPATLALPTDKTCDLELSLPGHSTYKLPASLLKETDILRTTLRKRRSPRRRVKPRRKPTPAVNRPVSKRGTLVVTSVQVGKVFVNDLLMGDTPRLRVSLRPGKYRVRVQFPSLGTGTATRTITIRRGKTTKMHVEP